MDNLLFMIKTLIKEGTTLETEYIPNDFKERELLLRALMNVRKPGNISKEFLIIQDEYLKNKINYKGITKLNELKTVSDFCSKGLKNPDKMYLWQGDITTIQADAIVNAANKKLLGCTEPLHYCIDNTIHTFAGIQLRNECYNIMLEQGFDEPIGNAKITKGYNLPSKYVIHTVGPIVNKSVGDKEENLLRSSYLKSLELAKEKGLESIVFCSISTGVFGFPKEQAAQIAIETVDNFLNDPGSIEQVVFNVYSKKDYDIYTKLLKVEINEEK